VTFVVDTNVLVVANARESPQASPECVLSCTRPLLEITMAGRLALDTGDRILHEYKRYSNWHGQPGVGDKFFKWVVDNLWNAEHCDLIEITPEGDSFAEFPRDLRLSGFDLADRKFIAVAAAHADQPPVLQTVDTKWRQFVEALADCGISVQFLCN